MNEALFFIHALVAMCLLFGSLALGREPLIAYISTCWLIANLFVTKQILLFGYECTASDVYVIAALLGTNIVQEFFGKKSAQIALWTSFYILLATAGMSVLHLAYTPSAHDSTQANFTALLQPAPRLAIASLLAFFISSRVDISIFSYLNKRSGMPLALRSFFTSLCVVSVDTVIFTFLGLWGLVSSLLDVGIVSLGTKIATSLLMTPFISFTKHFFFKRSHDPLSL